jgi:hypothetical protein
VCVMMSIPHAPAHLLTFQPDPRVREGPQPTHLCLNGLCQRIQLSISSNRPNPQQRPNIILLLLLLLLCLAPCRALPAGSYSSCCSSSLALPLCCLGSTPVGSQAHSADGLANLLDAQQVLQCNAPKDKEEASQRCCRESTGCYVRKDTATCTTNKQTAENKGSAGVKGTHQCSGMHWTTVATSTVILDGIGTASAGRMNVSCNSSVGSLQMPLHVCTAHLACSAQTSPAAQLPAAPAAVGSAHTAQQQQPQPRMASSQPCQLEESLPAAARALPAPAAAAAVQ